MNLEVIYGEAIKASSMCHFNDSLMIGEIWKNNRCFLMPPDESGGCEMVFSVPRDESGGYAHGSPTGFWDLPGCV